MATLLNPFLRALDANADSVSGGLLYVFEAGTTTPVTTYSDSAMTTAQAQPLVANSAGEFAGVFVPSGTYKIRVADSGAVVLYEVDDIRMADRPDDPVFFDTIADLLGSTDTYAAGSLLLTVKEGARYTALASGATSFSDENAGGQKLMRGYLAYDTVSDLMESVEPSRGTGVIWEGGGFRYEEAASGASDHHDETAGGVKLYWLDQVKYSLEYFGLSSEATPSTDQRAQVQEMLDFLAGKMAVITGVAKVGIGSPVNLPAAAHLHIPGLTLFGLSSWGSTDFAVQAEDISYTNLHGVTMDGNGSEFGDMYPTGSIAGPRGFAILSGCESVYLHDCRAINSNSNGFSSLAGGGEETSYNTGFIRCVATDCGVPFGQEIKTIAVSAAAANQGPQNVTFEDCRATGGNFGLYLAGGTSSVRGGYYDSKKNSALTMYCGDAAWSTTPARYDISGAEFHHTGAESNNQAVGALGIAAASSLASYGEQPDCSYTLTGCELSHGALGAVLIAEEGPTMVFDGCTFRGGNQSIQFRPTTSGASGTFKEGRMTLNSPLFTEWGGSGTTEYSVQGPRPIEINGGHWTEPNTTTGECIYIQTGSDIVLRNPVFGSTGATQQPRFGVFNAGSLVPDRFIMEGSVDLGLTGGITSASSSQIPNLFFKNSTPSNSFDRKDWTQSPAAPANGTWARGDIVWNTTPVVASGSIKIGWSCVTAGTPGTWEPMYVSNT